MVIRNVVKLYESANAVPIKRCSSAIALDIALDIASALVIGIGEQLVAATN